MLSRIIVALSIVAILLSVGVAVAGPGTRFGLWPFMTGLALVQGLALPVMAAAVVSLVMTGLSFWKSRKTAPVAIAALLASAAAASVPVGMLAAAQGNPMIHDITTDVDNPPAIIAGADAERANPPAYVGADPVPGDPSGQTIMAAQKAAFPDLVPANVDGPLDAAAERVRGRLEAMGMETLASGPSPGETAPSLTIEAVATTFWFGFKDDFVVRLIEQPDGRVRIDVRSKSRVGLSDLGANAARIREFLSGL
jgi:hypothetical protein